MRALIVLMLIGGVASAHQSSTKYVDVRITGDRAELTLRCAPGDVTEPMHLAPDAKPTASAAAAAPLVPAYVARWLEVRTPDGATCSASAQTARAEDDGFLAVHWIATCPHPIARVVLDFTALFALDRKMEALVRLGETESRRVTAASAQLVLDVETPRAVFPEELAIALLIVVLASTASTLVRSARAAAIVLALYLAAHVAGSALVEIPPELARIVLPATLIYAALESAIRPDLRWRALTFVGFGLVQGAARAPDLEVATTVGVGIGALVMLPVVRLAVARFTQRRVMVATVCVVAGVCLLQLALG